MNIKGIRYQNYDNRGVFWPKDSPGQKRQHERAPIVKKPIDAITVENFEVDDNRDSTDNEVALLTQLVKSLPDDYVKERMYQVRDSYPIIDDFLVEKLIMEEL